MGDSEGMNAYFSTPLALISTSASSSTILPPSSTRTRHLPFSSFHLASMTLASK